MKGTFESTSASRVAAPLFCNIKGGLDKRLYLSDTLQGLLSPHIGHWKSCHIISIYTFPSLSTKKYEHCEKIFWVYLAE
jgi:hypothetical protein